MNLQTTEVFESARFPGVRFTLRRLTDRAVTDIRLQVAEASDGIKDQLVRNDAIESKVTEAFRDAKTDEEFNTVLAEALSPDETVEFVRGRLALSQIEARDVYPPYLKAGIERIEGLSFDGDDATLESFLAHAPDAMIGEVYERIRALCELSEAERKNFASPSTSQGSVDGATNNTTAEPVSPPAGTTAAIAAGTSPS